MSDFQKDGFGTLFQKVDDLGGEVTPIATEVGALGDRVTALEPQVTALQGAVTDLDGRMTQAEGRLVSAPSWLLPQPRVRAKVTTETPGKTRSNQELLCFGQVEVAIEGLPEKYRLDDTLRTRVEMLRYRPTHRSKTPKDGYVKMPRGFYHPTPWASFGGEGLGGTRGGGGGSGGPRVGDVPRPTEWSVVPDGPFDRLPFGGHFTLSVADVFAPWFDYVTIQDVRGERLTTLRYYIGSKKRVTTSGRVSTNSGPYLGVFAFRYIIFVDGRWVTGPLSEVVYVRPRVWPNFKTLADGFPRFLVPDVEGCRQLTVSVGTRMVSF
jgi:hypothetical protein